MLYQAIRDAPLLRYVASDDDLKRGVALVCFPKDVEQAIEWFRGRTGRLPEYLHLCGKAPIGPLPVGEIPVIELARSLEILTLVFDGRDPRKKGIYLAQNGVARHAFHRDPQYGHRRTDFGFYSKHRQELEQLWARLEDEESRLTLASIIKSRIHGNCGYLRIAEYAEYEHPLVRAEPGEAVADCGSFDGKTSIDFARRVGPAGKVFAFEPSPENRKRIRRNLKSQNVGNVKIVAKAVSAEVGSVRFSAGDAGSSRISENESDIEVPTVSLDHFIRKSGGLRLDVVSLDIEGAEPEALRGARRVIREQRPKFQISIYHENDHLFRLPLEFLQEHRDYALFLGHHNTYSTETDAYLVPRERLTAR
jgi:FkbM family methyltransferase